MIVEISKIIPLYKPLGWTPLQLGRQFAMENHLNGRVGYAGRLDPLADGVMIGLFGSANSRQSELLGLDKRYRFTIVLGITTDSYDLMGLPMIKAATPDIKRSTLLKLTNELIGDLDQAYPAYSAVRVNGQPLYYWARRNKLAEVEVPVARRHIFDLKLTEMKTITSRQLLGKVEHDIALIQGDFRQDEIVYSWQQLLSTSLATPWPTATFEVHCSSGTYIRSLADLIGQRMGAGATTLRLTRTAVGNYQLADCQRLTVSI